MWRLEFGALLRNLSGAFTQGGDLKGHEVVAGQIFGFRTMPISEFSSSDTGRFAAIKIIGCDSRFIVVAVLDGVWGHFPSLDAAANCNILVSKRFNFKDRLAVFGEDIEFWSLSKLANMKLLGELPLSSREVFLASRVLNWEVGSTFGPLSGANSDAEGEWRWVHDHESLVAEIAKEKEKQDAERAAAEARWKNRLRGLTWEKLLSENPFERWSPSPPFPPKEFTLSARQQIRRTCEDMRALGDKPRKAAARRILKECVEWFNTADEFFGLVIETEEREDICAVLEEIAVVAKHKSLVDEIELWRSW